PAACPATGCRRPACSTGIAPAVARFTQQALDARTAVDRIVVVEMQFGHVAHVQRLGQLVAHLVRHRLQALDRLVRAFGLEHRDEDLGVRHVAGDLDVRDTGERQPVLAHGRLHQGTQLTPELGGDAICSLETLHSVRWTSMRSKHSIWSPGLTSLYCFTPMPHSVLTRTSSTFSLKRRRDSSSPSKMTVLSRNTRIGLFRLTTPSTTMQPATAPNLELRNTSRTSAVPMISSRISTPRMPDATCFTWSMTS